MTATTTPRRDRRRLLSGLAAASIGIPWLTGCGGLRRLPVPEIDEQLPADLPALLAPGPIHKPGGTPAQVIDVHAHFFNAQDVPVAGYLSGPVAHGRPDLADLIRALAPYADALAGLAPSARTEFQDLLARARRTDKSLAAMAAAQGELDDVRDRHLGRVSRAVYEQLRGSEFEARFNRMKATPGPAALRSLGEEAAAFGPGSLYRATERERLGKGAPVGALRRALAPGEPLPAHADGVLAFLGHMLSYRWMNLRAYQQAYSTGPEAFGVDLVLGALVDFDRWLSPAARVAQEDQIRLHQLLSVLSGGYLRPLVAYNPWSDVASRGAALERVLDALDRRGFIGVKIYPPNGFRPWGNRGAPMPDTRAPDGAALDDRLALLWRACAERGVPVMAHGGHSMGKDDAHEEMAGPSGWRQLLDRRSEAAPLINIGHIGGDAAEPPWTSGFAELMALPSGRGLFGDLGYWASLRCDDGMQDCAARDRLARLLQHRPVLADRLMYGSDWLMLSQERRWPRYPFDLAAATAGLLNPQALFAGNARRCFTRL